MQDWGFEDMKWVDDHDPNFDPPDLEASDWRKASHYTYLNKCSYEQWGWEFLRRNREYIGDWHKKNDELKKKKKQKAFPHDPEVFKKWGINNLSNPQSSALSSLVFDYPNIRFIAGILHPLHSDSINKNAFLKSDEFAVIIDMGKPLEPQFKALQPYLIKLKIDSQLKQSRPTNQKSRWIEYIRVLDAKVAGVNPRDAADVIFQTTKNKPAIDNWIDTLKQANRMTKSGFRKLLLPASSIVFG